MNQKTCHFVFFIYQNLTISAEQLTLNLSSVDKAPAYIIVIAGTRSVHCPTRFNRECHPPVCKPNSRTQPSGLHDRFNHYLDTHRRVLADIARSFRYSHQHALIFRASEVEYPLISCFYVGTGIVLRKASKLKRRIVV